MMTLRLAGNLVGAVLALAVPLAALTAAAEPEHEAFGLAVAPFGWPRLVVAHLLATLPLSVLAAVLVHRRLADRASPLALGVCWAVLGVGLAWMTLSAGFAVGVALEQCEAGFAGRLAGRALWCLVLQLPWCLLGQDLAGAAAGRVNRPLGVPVVLALIVAVGLPAVYAETLIDTQSKKVEELLQGGRLKRALGLVEGLCDLGSSGPLAGTEPRKLRLELARAVQVAAATAAKPLPTSAPAGARLERARLLALVDRIQEAERELEPVADADPEAALLLAAVLQDQKRWEESSHSYRRALALLEGAPVSDPAAVAGRVRAYNGLAFNARERKAYGEAEAAYQEGLEKLPERARAPIHFQLGRHYQHSGRPAKALEHLRTAARLDPAGYGERTRPLIGEITRGTPGCLPR